jgi:ligand-binding SRPBCC domain-containing protein
MPVIQIETIIHAPIDRVFNLARSIDLHQVSAGKTNEKAIAGKTTGLIELGDEVTWQARHFGVQQKLSVRITAMNRPHDFTDQMIRGAFKRFDHQHQFFSESDQTTRMVDVFDYTSPFGLLGKMADALFLKRYMTEFLNERNQVIKAVAESEKWKAVLGVNE